MHWERCNGSEMVLGLSSTGLCYAQTHGPWWMKWRSVVCRGLY